MFWWSSLLLAFPAACWLWQRWQSSKKCTSPPSLPVIGNLHLLGRLPHRSLSALAEGYGPLLHLSFGSMPVFVISSPEVAEEVFKTKDAAFATRPRSGVIDSLSYNSQDLVFAPYGDYWRTVRRLTSLHLLSTARVQSFRRVREEEVALMVKTLRRSEGVVNLSEMLVRLSSNTVCRIALGKKYFDEGENGERFRKMLKEFSDVIGSYPVGDFIPCLRWVDWVRGLLARARIVHRDFDDFFERVLSEHQGDKDDVDGNKIKSFMDLLVGLRQDDDGGHFFTRETIKAIIMDTFVGGTDTIFAAMEWTMGELIRNPKKMNKLKQEIRQVAGEEEGGVKEEDMQRMPYLKAAVKESLRLHPPVPLLLPRESIQDVRINGREIPRGTRIFVNAWAIGRSPRDWEQTEEFMPERFLNSGIDYRGQDFQLIPFGAGRRGCPGVAFSTAIIELAVANLVYHFDWRLPDGKTAGELDLAENPGIINHMKSAILAFPVLKISSSL